MTKKSASQRGRMVTVSVIALLAALAITGAILRVPRVVWGEPLGLEGLPSVPIITPTGQQEQVVRVYFLIEGGDLDPEESANYRAVSRTVEADSTTQALLEATLRELLKGPTQEEQAQGIGPNMFSPATANLLEGASVENGQAIVNLRDWREIIPQVGTSTGLAIFNRQLSFTVLQFPEIDQIIFQLEGSCDEYWASLESVCHPILRGDYRPPP
ncbi:MAG: GerMN domain-containing protein [Actinomycetota bacterium]